MNLVEYLMDSKTRGSADASRLQSMGKTAAREYLETGKPLDDSISGLAKEAGLNVEQITRVAEYANNETFIQKFAQPYDKNVSFPLADARSITQNIQTKSAVEKTASVKVHTARRYIPGSERGSIEEVFGGRSLEKVAEAARPSDEQLMKRYRGLKDTMSNVQADQRVLESDFLAKFAQLDRMVLQEARHGTPSWAVGAAVAAANPSERLYEVIAADLGDKMSAVPLAKLAQDGYEVEPDNAVTGLVQELESVAQKLLASEETVQRTKMAIDELLTLLRGQPGPNPTSDLFAANASTTTSADPQSMQAQQGQGQLQAPQSPPSVQSDSQVPQAM